MNITNLKIGTRLGYAFGLIVIIMGLLSIWSVSQMNTLANLTQQMKEHPLVVSNAVRDIKTNIVAMHRSMKDVTLAETPQEFDAAIQTVSDMEKNVYELFKVVNRQFLGDKSSVDEAQQAFRNWKSIRDEVISLVQTDQKVKAAQITKNKGAAHIGYMFEKVEFLIDFAGNKAETFYSEAKTIRAMSIRMMVLISIAAFGVALIIAYTTTRSITVPLITIMETAQKIACGDLTATVEVEKRQDEIGNLMQSFHTMLKNLRDQAKQMTEGASSLASAISQISATATQLASSSSETSTTIAEVTSTVEEVKHTAHLANDKAEHVAMEAEEITKVSAAGKKDTEQSVVGMKKIMDEMEYVAESIVRLSEQTQSIGEIISAVNDLTDQSNLLSVNASIEAAKAGEYGKGFTVVAQEVKSLAEQSKEATTQIKSILNEIQKATSSAVMATERGSRAVETGMKLVSAAGETIATLQISVGESSQAAAQIAASSQQQLGGMDQLASAMENIKDATAQNVNGAKQLENASKNLDDLGQNLKELAVRFRV